jgi:hypothetical protein
MPWGSAGAEMRFMNAQPIYFPESYRDTLVGFGAMYEEWRVASEAAATAEDRLYREFCEQREGHGAGPNEAQRWTAQLLREAANERLERAMRELREHPL